MKATTMAALSLCPYIGFPSIAYQSAKYHLTENFLYKEYLKQFFPKLAYNFLEVPTLLLIHSGGIIFINGENIHVLIDMAVVWS